MSAGQTRDEPAVAVGHVRLKGSARLDTKDDGVVIARGVMCWFSGCSCGWVDGAPRSASSAAVAFANHRDGRPPRDGVVREQGLHVILTGHAGSHHGGKMLFVACACGWAFKKPATTERCHREFEQHLDADGEQR